MKKNAGNCVRVRELHSENRVTDEVNAVIYAVILQVQQRERTKKRTKKNAPLGAL